MLEGANYCKTWQNPQSGFWVARHWLLPVCLCCLSVKWDILSCHFGDVLLRQINLHEAHGALCDEHHREAHKEMNNSVFSSGFQWCAWARPRDTHWTIKITKISKTCSLLDVHSSRTLNEVRGGSRKKPHVMVYLKTTWCCIWREARLILALLSLEYFILNLQQCSFSTAFYI